MAEIVGCWHHGNLQRLRKCLANGYCDLHPLAAHCPPRRMSAQYWYQTKMGLKVGDLVRFCVEKRQIVAVGRIASGPYMHPNPVDANWPGAVNVTEVEWINGGVCMNPPVIGSHKLHPPVPFKCPA